MSTQSDSRASNNIFDVDLKLYRLWSGPSEVNEWAFAGCCSESFFDEWLSPIIGSDLLLNTLCFEELEAAWQVESSDEESSKYEQN